FALDFPYDPALYFHGEEQSLALRLYTQGWSIYHPPGMPIYHLYEDGQRSRRPMHWEDDRARFPRLEAASRRRLLDLISGKALGAYGLGSARSLDDFAAFSGIDYKRRVLDQKAYGAGAIRNWARFGV